MMTLLNKSKVLALATIAVMIVAWSLPEPAEARRGGGGHRSVKGKTHTNVNRNRNVNKNRNVNRNTNVNRNRNVNVSDRRNVNINKNVNIDVDHRHGGYYGRNYHPVATAAAVTATAAVVGSIIYSLPSNCQTIVTNNVSYRQCGSTWYQPRYSGGSTSYVVVNSPY
ncbi:MAG: DUF6515 family protein [Pseudomonadota bacterium]